VYIITVHSVESAQWMARLVERIYHPGDGFLVHTDDQDRLATEATVRAVFDSIARAHPEVPPPRVVLRTARRNHWGRIDQVLTSLDMLQVALTDFADINWTHAVSLSGDSYPLWERDCLRAQFFANADKNFISVVRWPAGDRRIMRCHPEPEPALTSDQLWHGASWFALNREFAAWSLQAAFTRQLLAFMSCALSVDESFFQTLLMASPFAPKDPEGNATTHKQHFMYHIFTRGAHPLVLQPWQIDSVFEKPFLFLRKVRTNETAQAVDARITGRDCPVTGGKR
jgi:hypothetical protein